MEVFPYELTNGVVECPFEKDLMKKQIEEIDSTQWVALHMMQKRRNLLSRRAEEVSSQGLNS